MANCETPCPQCPFARATPKSYLDTKGKNGHRFIGQSVGPYDLPCHMVKDFDKWFEKFLNDEESRPCIGARRYRANLGLTHLLPKQLTDGDTQTDFETVFGGHDELLAHHLGVTIEEAREILKRNPPVHMLAVEMMTMKGAVKAVKEEHSEGGSGE